MSMTDSEAAIYQDFLGELTIIDAIERLEKLGYHPKDARSLVDEWADALEDEARKL